jgi:hypothetical protein
MVMGSVRLSRMKVGYQIIPPWFVEACCVVIGRSPLEVMGPEWVRRFGEDGRGGRAGQEIAPTAIPIIGVRLVESEAAGTRVEGHDDAA